MMMLYLKNPIINAHVKTIFLTIVEKLVGVKEKVVSFVNYHLKYNKIFNY